MRPTLAPKFPAQQAGRGATRGRLSGNWSRSKRPSCPSSGLTASQSDRVAGGRAEASGERGHGGSLEEGPLLAPHRQTQPQASPNQVAATRAVAAGAPLGSLRPEVGPPAPCVGSRGRLQPAWPPLCGRRRLEYISSGPQLASARKLPLCDLSGAPVLIWASADAATITPSITRAGRLICLKIIEKFTTPLSWWAKHELVFVGGHNVARSACGLKSNLCAPAETLAWRFDFFRPQGCLSFGCAARLRQASPSVQASERKRSFM